MQYEVNRYVRECLDGTEMIRDEATHRVREHARQIVELGLCDRVEVADERGEIVFRWPRTLHAASPRPKG